jgi:diguanylate cyclase (GGDEF)-like protein/PAS domain S-box-containing protein
MLLQNSRMSNHDPASPSSKDAPSRIPGIVSGVWRRGAAAERAAAERTHSTFRHVGIGVAWIGFSGEWLDVNERLCQMLGLSTEALLETSLAALAHPDDRGSVVQLAERAHEGEFDSFVLELRCRHSAGHWVWLQLTAAGLPGSESEPAGFMALLQDISEQKRAQEESLRTKHLLEATLANIHDGVALLDAERRILVANRAYADLFALDPAQLVGLTREEFVTHVARLAHDPGSVQLALDEEPTANAISSREFLLRLPRRRHLRRTLQPIGVASERLLLVVWRDVTAEHDLIAERERELFTDALTGIASRRAAENALHRELARLSRGGSGFSVALFDLDHFKSINDHHGHPVGDDVLRRVASILATVARATDVVARWGGEEFIAIISADLEGARAFCERARQAVAELYDPEVGRITLSAGVTDCSPGEAAQTIVARADRALYAAKGQGRNRVMSESGRAAAR